MRKCRIYVPGFFHALVIYEGAIFFPLFCFDAGKDLNYCMASNQKL